MHQTFESKENFYLKKKEEKLFQQFMQGPEHKKTFCKCFHKQILSKNALSRLNSIQQFEVSEISTPQKRSRNQKKTQKSREKLLI